MCSFAGTASLLITDDVTADGSSRVNSGVYRNICSDPTKCLIRHWKVRSTRAKILFIGFDMQQDNDLKRNAAVHHRHNTKKNTRVFQGQKIECSLPTKSFTHPDTNWTQAWINPQHPKTKTHRIQAIVEFLVLVFKLFDYFIGWPKHNFI